MLTTGYPVLCLSDGFESARGLGLFASFQRKEKNTKVQKKNWYVHTNLFRDRSRVISVWTYFCGTTANGTCSTKNNEKREGFQEKPIR